MTAAELQAIAAEAEEQTLLIQGTTDQARLMSYIPIPTTTRDIHLPKERP